MRLVPSPPCQVVVAAWLSSLLLAALAPSVAHARCELAALETSVVPTDHDLARVDRWTWRVGPGQPDCVEVHLASPANAPIESAEARIDRPGERAPRRSGQRLRTEQTSLDASMGPAAGLVVVTPELQDGDLLVITTKRRWPLGDGRFVWRPGARGALELAILLVDPGAAGLPPLQVRGAGVELGSPQLRAEPVGRRRWELQDTDLEGAEAAGPEPISDGPLFLDIALDRSSDSVVRQVQALLLPARRPRRGLSDPALGSTLVATHRQGPLPTRVVVPAGALASWCQVEGAVDPCPELGQLGFQLPARGTASWGWIQPGAAPSGEASLAGPLPRSTASFSLFLPTSELLLRLPAGVSLDGQPATGEQSEPSQAGGPSDPLVSVQSVATTGVAGSADLAAALGLRSLDLLPAAAQQILAEHLPVVLSATATAQDVEPLTPWGLPEARLTWRLSRLEEAHRRGARWVDILPTSSDAWQAVAWLAIRASMPEPALPVDLKGRRTDPTVLPELLDRFRAQLHLASLPGQAALQPRSLMRVRRSGAGSPWELALVLTRYLSQLKLDAMPLPVRPLALGPADPASLTDWPLAVVRVRIDDEDHWLDPSCSSCGVDALGPQLDGAAVLSPELSRLPALAPSRWHREVSTRADGVRDVVVEIQGPLAVSLRTQLSAVDPRTRASWLANRLVAPGAWLVEHQGLVDGEGPLRLVFELASPQPLSSQPLSSQPLSSQPLSSQPLSSQPLVPPLLAPGFQGSDQVILPARGEWSERQLISVDSTTASALWPGQASRWLGAQSDGLLWHRSLRPESGAPGDVVVLEESLRVDELVTSRAAATALLGRLSQQWGRLPESVRSEETPPPVSGLPAEP